MRSGLKLIINSFNIEVLVEMLQRKYTNLDDTGGIAPTGWASYGSPPLLIACPHPDYTGSKQEG